MRIRFLAAVLFALAVFVVKAGADTIFFKNGDRITGTINGSDGKTVTIETDFAGEIKGSWTAIREVTSDKTLFVLTPDKKTVSGTISVVTSDAGMDLVVHTTSSGDVHLPVEKIGIIRSKDAEEAYEKSLHPPLTANWKSELDAGLALARGNSQTTNFNLGFHATRKTLTDQILTSASTIYSTNDAPGGGVTANTILGAARYDRDLYDAALFAFGSGDFTHDALQGLDLRSIYSGGLGWHAIHSSRTTLNVLAGVNYTRESYSPVAGSATTSPLQRSLMGGTFGEDFKHQLSSITTLTEVFNFYPDFTNTGEYRMALDAGATTKVNSWLGWQVTFSDRYVSDPPVIGTKPNDIIFSTGLTATFGH